MNPNTPKVLYQEANPYGSFTAFLEDDGRTIYLYLQSHNNPEWPMKTLWVRNLIDAPDSRTDEDFDLGLAPVLTKSELTDTKAQSSLTEDQIHFIWSEEGDAVALFVEEELQAYLPSWSGIKGIHGYSKFAKEEAPTASPLGDPENGVIAERVRTNRKFWESVAEKDHWKKAQNLRLEFLESKLGKHQTYWSADGGKYPSLGIASFLPKEFPGIKIFSTIGMSVQNQPSIELYHKDYENFSRIELVFAIQLLKDAPDKSETWIQHVLGEMVKFPWNTGIWFGHSHTIQNPRKDPDQLYLDFNWFVFRNVTEELEQGSNELLPKLNGLITENGKRTNFLFLTPISTEERICFMREGSQKFWDTWKKEGYGFFHDSERRMLEF
ncbi:MAG: suppressor of fused domain protein [Leptospira bouyouniensis]|uniref:Suppressor of fused domain protein n=1 Tax=Leptospira bouyouniensis TaxID=2484911 RepID=A0A7I0HW77_9LEPT|nr:suppressor of fused domain protein [Leptospira bouyouniensis]TGK53072.1 suppressor of fused domain protein [Leptospira bouyouniensis]TGL08292.1 suppressor of fused domain protein [Leptospira bouyouniensis]TGM87289.1 suppressor of fused domain protein [Leptospira bouyouniensis]